MINFSIETKNSKNVDVRQRKIILEDKEWFVKEFIRSFLFVYANKVFYISKDGKEILLSPKDMKEKEKWLTETAEDDFNDYVANPKAGYKALAGFIDHIPVGIILYRELKEERVLYLAQGFIVPEYQKKGIGSNLLEKLLEQIAQDFDEFHVLTRHQNDAAMSLYNQVGFSVGTAEIVEKYGYNPMRYISFIKHSPQRKQAFDAKKVEHSDLGAQNEEWFRTQMKAIYKSIYDKKSLLIQKSNGLVTLGIDSFAEKEEWISETIENCLDQFYVNPKPEFKSLVFNYEEQAIACFLFEVNSETINVVEAFVVEEYRGKGLFKLFINTISSYKNIGVKNIKINVRHQNETMIQCVSKMGFYANAELSSAFYVSYQKSIENFELRKISARGIQFLDIKSEDHEWLVINYGKHFLNAFNGKIYFSPNENNENNPLILKDEQMKKKFATGLANKYLNDLNQNMIKLQIIFKNNEKIGAIFFKLDISSHSLIILDFFTVDAEILQNILSDFVKHSRNNNGIRSINTIVNHQNERLIQALVNINFQMESSKMAFNEHYQPLYQKLFFLN
ncbi:hypothetical protein BpHYR1_049672 [Brachionus plicatilis]|uniref:N-acetyltransferase domain-containing protein n=1 Tax=Brachionus plicatilis TaxID=10195 RepID=A0A3M7QQX5_BRAPC|nr:hypothetical protein BpHYR1_049672 [Brachionus plicatilis]